MGEIIFITGTDTGVGKTVLTALLLQHLRAEKIHAVAMKPFCTGNRDDVKILQKLQPGEWSDAEMNPYFFPQPLAPFVAAKLAGKKIVLSEVMEKIGEIKKRCDVLLVEGAGGVMVPLAKGFWTINLIAKLGARVVIVGRNQLGTINHTLLTAHVLQEAGVKRLAIVLMGQPKRDASDLSNRVALRELVPFANVFALPFFGENQGNIISKNQGQKKIKKILAAIVKGV